jgi:hypothetical protein
MHKYKQAAISIAFLTIIFTSGISAGYIDAPDQEETQNRKNLSKQEAILETFENNDYQTWKNIIAKQGDIGKLVTEADFNKFILARSAARSAEYDKAIAIAKELEDALKNKMGLKLLA